MVTALSIVVLWILLVGGTRRNEMLVGIAVFALCGLFFYRVWQAETVHLDLRLKDLAQGWRIPWYILTGISEISVILFRDCFGIRKADSFYRVSGFKTAKSDPRLVARHVLAVFYTTMTPNFVVIGIDYRQSRMLFHQLERSAIPLMTQALGAQPGAPQ